MLRAFDTGSPLSVGNGELAFTADVTGLQTFAEAYDETIPLGTLSQWGWHTAPNPEGFAIERFRFTEFDAHGRAVGYADIPGDRRTPEIEWLRANPHRLHLGRIGFRFTLRDGRAATRDDLTDVEQTLDLWNGVLRSRFRIEGEPVAVETLCHPALDLVAVRVVSRLVGLGRIAVRLRFPYGTGAATAADWTRPDAHETQVVRQAPTSAALDRRLDGDRYHVRLAWAPEAELVQEEKHAFVLAPGRGRESLEAVIGFSPTPATEALPTFDETRRAAREHWNRFWTTGGAIDLSRQPRPPLARARAPDRPLAVPHRDPVLRSLPAAGNGADLQQLGGQVPPGDALVARRALRPVGPPSSSWSGASATTTRSCRGRGRRPGARATPAPGGPR